jgi:integrase
VSLVKARDKASAARALVNDGIDPIEHTRTRTNIPAAPKRASSPSFEEVAEAYMADRLKRLRSEIHRHQWRQSLLDYAYPIIGKMPVDEIDTNDVLAVLRPIWEAKCETATRVRGRIERILARATVEGLRRGANPATWRGHLQEALPARSEVQPVQHFRAMEFPKLIGRKRRGQYPPVGRRPIVLISCPYRPVHLLLSARSNRCVV